MTTFSGDGRPLSLLAVFQGQWGERIADNVARLGPASWTVHRWAAPRVLPVVIDDPEDYLPATLPQADLILALGETAGVAQLLPDVVKMSGARSVIAPIDRNESLPPGLIGQLQRWLADLEVSVVFPKPFCSLTESTYNYPPLVTTYDDPIIQQFARRFGRPQFAVEVGDDKRIVDVKVERDSACGCAQSVAQGLIGSPVADAEHEAGMLHHHFPCLASMNQDADYNDTLMHISGRIVREAIKEQVQTHLDPTPYFRPMGRVEDERS